MRWSPSGQSASEGSPSGPRPRRGTRAYPRAVTGAAPPPPGTGGFVRARGRVTSPRGILASRHAEVPLPAASGARGAPSWMTLARGMPQGYTPPTSPPVRAGRRWSRRRSHGDPLPGMVAGASGPAAIVLRRLTRFGRRRFGRMRPVTAPGSRRSSSRSPDLRRKQRELVVHDHRRPRGDGVETTFATTRESSTS